ncbi:MAG TPA: 2-isopropylmalate synthase, partial [Spirochaetia bacterium]|nr:2-isopropylmalate synthase [Spirochaetia bacterium]
MARRIEIFDTTLRDGNKLPFAVLSPDDRLLLANQLARLGVDVLEAGWPGSSAEESACVRRIASEVRGPRIAALARALDSDVEKALEALRDAQRPQIHVYLSVSPQFLAAVLKETEADAIRSLGRCLSTARMAGVRVQCSLSEAPHGRPEFVRDVCVAARESGAQVINLADTNGILTPERASELVAQVREYLGGRGAAPDGTDAPVIGIHCHNDLGLATANSLSAILAGASHVEVTVGGFGERAGNASLEEIAFLISAYGERYGLAHGVHLQEIARTSQLLDSLTGIRTHPNKPIIGQLAFVPVAGGFPGKSLDRSLGALMQEKTIGRGSARIAVPI